MSRSFMRTAWAAVTIGIVAAALLTLPGRHGESDAGFLAIQGYRCFKVAIVKGAPKFEKFATPLLDDLALTNSTVLKPLFHCRPVVVGEPGGVIGAATPLTCFKAKDPRGTPKLGDIVYNSTALSGHVNITNVPVVLKVRRKSELLCLPDDGLVHK